jgi:ribosomal protein S17E
VDQILKWAKDEYESNKDVIEDYSTAQVKQLVADNDHVLVLVCK